MSSNYYRVIPLTYTGRVSYFDNALGSCLYQYENTDPVAIAYASKTMTAAERNYSVQEKEALGVIHAVEKFRHHLLGNPFTIQILTDHKSLEYIQKGKEKGGRIARWAIKLSEYDYKITYVKGADNTVADLLSRLISASNKGLFGGQAGHETKSLLALMLPDNPALHAAVIRGHDAEGKPKQGAVSGSKNSSTNIFSTGRASNVGGWSNVSGKLCAGQVPILCIVPPEEKRRSPT
eukprot:SAG11_NODE_6105_length_1387_cov_3.563665_1_plen_235_part_00